MSANLHINTLNNKCDKLNEDIKHGHIHHYLDEDLSEMKKKRLRIKEEIEIMTKRLQREEALEM